MQLDVLSRANIDFEKGKKGALIKIRVGGCGVEWVVVGLSGWWWGWVGGGGVEWVVVGLGG